MSALFYMRRAGVWVILALCLFTTLSFARETPPSTSKKLNDSASGNVPVLTFKYDNQHTGANTDETILNVQNVSSPQFGKRMTYPVDGQIYAQPLYVPDVNADGQVRNLVIVATQSNSVYAFDADNFSQKSAVWHRNLMIRGARAVTAGDVHCQDLIPKIGITSTPVIDPNTQTLFVVSYFIANNRFIYHLHALDLSTGHDKVGSPTEVRVPGIGFNGQNERQRAALLLSKGHLYMAFASFCDREPYHGWILNYTYHRGVFRLATTLNTTPTGKEGGVWGGAGPLATDENGYIYTATGNGTFDLDKGGHNAGDSYLKLSPDLKILDYFTPFNQQCLNAADGDLGSGGPLILPGNRMVGGTKGGKIFVVDTTHMGHYNAVDNPCKQGAVTTLDHIIQEHPQHTAGNGVYTVPTYWNGYVYFSGVKESTQAFPFEQGRLSTPTSSTPEKIGFAGGNAVISSNGTGAGTGILWLINKTGTLLAYDATNLSKKLFSGTLGSFIKFSVPVVSNGKVFVPTAHSLQIFGLQADNLKNPPEQNDPGSTPTPQADPTSVLPNNKRSESAN